MMLEAAKYIWISGERASDRNRAPRRAVRASTHPNRCAVHPANTAGRGQQMQLEWPRCPPHCWARTSVRHHASVAAVPCCSLFDLPVCFRVILVWIGITKAQPLRRAYGRLMLRTICGSASGHWSVALSLTVCLLLVPRSRTMLTLLLAESH